MKPLIEAPDSAAVVVEEGEEGGRVGCASGVEGFGGGSGWVCCSDGIVEFEGEGRRVPPQLGVKVDVYILVNPCCYHCDCCGGSVRLAETLLVMVMVVVVMKDD